MTDEQLTKLMEALIGEMRGMREDIKSLDKRLPLTFDPDKLKASTSNPEALPALSVVEPKDPTKPNLIEPWPPGTTQKKPEPVRG